MPPSRLDRLERRPGRLGELGGQRLEAARTRRRIADPGEVRFLDQDDLAVARHPPGEGVGEAQRLRVGQER